MTNQTASHRPECPHHPSNSLSRDNFKVDLRYDWESSDLQRHLHGSDLLILSTWLVRTPSLISERQICYFSKS